MTHRHAKHANQVVEHFKQALPDSTRKHIGAKHFDELALMIESALSATVLEALEQAADRVEALATGLRRSAEEFDD